MASGTFAVNGSSQAEDVVSVYGLTVTRYYPGPPNYDSARKQEKIKVILTVDSIDRTKEKPIQLYFPPEKRALAACVVSGCKARVSGRLFEAESGHHHTTQILEVTNFELDVECKVEMHAAGTRTTRNHSLNRNQCGVRPFGLKKPSQNARPPQRPVILGGRNYRVHDAK